MVILGRVQNGVIVLEGEQTLPEGATVAVSISESAAPVVATPKARIQVPLVRTAQPGSVHLNNQRIAEILDEEDAAPRH